MTRIPVPIERDVPEQQPEMPPPAVSLLRSRKLDAPDSTFIADLTMAIRAGVRPLTAAQWLGVSRKLWKRWRQRTGGVYDELRDAMLAALAHLETRLQADLAKRSPGQALKGLRRVRDDDPEPASRPYHQHGLHSLKKALPTLLQRASDPALADTDLSDVERAIREWRESVIADRGGRDTLTTLTLSNITAADGLWVLLTSARRFIGELAEHDGLVSRKHRKFFPIVEQYIRLIDSFARLSQVIGTERAAPKTVSLDEYVRERYSDGNGDAPPADDPARGKETE